MCGVVSGTEVKVRPAVVLSAESAVEAGIVTAETEGPIAASAVLAEVLTQDPVYEVYRLSYLGRGQ